MKLKSLHTIKICAILFLAFTSFATNAQEVKWLSWEEAVELANTDKAPKKMFIDVYTDWCGWCKKMDADTFQNPEVATYMAKNYYMVKLDGERKEPLEYKGQTYKFVASGRSGYHEFAAALMQGKMSYPTTIFLDEKQQMLSPVPGYQKPTPFLKIAKYFGEDIHKTKKWAEYDTKAE
ncbi:DUF255 domain-containing protein [Cellulophaga sp. 20_2_10]|uniref:thioredoxin family protein n=1 Tax=Cellulophaga sp. 20_2_10 TaxID=2942476 RepID=UPI00201A2420|nr:DUF255 domain-containing protein [Cellulophaga sp. 20_2_10]MCL5246034.1 DUF255 domain-containing protein [Cellulophaga sp. 20_2_10]